MTNHLWKPARRLVPFALAASICAAGMASAQPSKGTTLQLVPLAFAAPSQHLVKGSAPAACAYPDGTLDPFLHCYGPAQIAAAYGVDKLHARGLLGQGQTIVLVDAYGSPTAAQDLQTFHDTFYPTLPNPNFDEVYPNGTLDYNNTSNGNGLSGPSGAAGWSGEATLDIEWAYAIAPLAHIKLIAVPPAETLGPQGLPNLFKAIQDEINSDPAGTVFSQSFGLAEQTFNGAAQSQTSKFDAVYQAGIAKGDTFLAASGDNGSSDVSKQAKETRFYPTQVAGWPATSPYVTAVGGTQLQYGWTWAPKDPSKPFLDVAGTQPNPAYFAWTAGGNSEAVWNESWLPAASGGGASVIYSRPAYQANVASIVGSARGIPDLSWNAAVNGGVLVDISAFPSYNCNPGQTSCWQIIGGTSAATPQVAGVIALANQARAQQGKAPLGNINSILYSPEFASASSSFSGAGTFRDIVPQRYGAAVLNDNRLWQYNADGLTVSPGPIAGLPTTTGYDLTTGFGSPRADSFVAALASRP